MPTTTHLIVDLGRVEPEPRPRRPVAHAKREQVVKDRLEQINWHNHVEVFGPLFARLLKLKGADPEQIARLGPTTAVPPQFGCAGAVKIASSRTYSQ